MVTTPEEMLQLLMAIQSFSTSTSLLVGLIRKIQQFLGISEGYLLDGNPEFPNSRSMSSKPARWAKSYGGFQDVYLATLILHPEKFQPGETYKSSNWKDKSYSKPPFWSYILIFRGERGVGPGIIPVISIQFHISTLPEASLINKNRPSQKEMSCSHHWFSAAMLVSGGISILRV